MNVEVYAVDGILPQPELSQLKRDFKAYKSGLIVHPDFGKDVPFTDNPNAKSANLQHLHLVEIYESSNWIGKILRRIKPTSDRWLIYTHGDSDPNKYLIIAIAYPNAHEKARGTDMGYWIEVAQPFAWSN